MTRDDKLARYFLDKAGLQEVTDEILASEMTLKQIQHFSWNVQVYRDQASDGVMPNMDEINDGSLPPGVFEKVRTIIAIAVGDASNHRPGRPN
jgi:hypothetical protein